MKIVAIACMDRRHTGGLSKKLAARYGCDETDIYFLRAGGGFGNFAGLKGPRTEGLLMDVDLAIRKTGAKNIVGITHGVSKDDMGGCAAYIDQGFADRFETIEKSREFIGSELAEATQFLSAWLTEKGYSDVSIETLPVSFSETKENILEESAQAGVTA